MNPSCAPRPFTQDKSTGDGPVQQAITTTLGLTLSAVVISHKTERFTVASSRMEKLGLGVERLHPFAIDDPCTRASLTHGRDRGPCSGRCEQIKHHSLVLTETSAIEGCESDWLLLFDDDSLPWAVPQNNFTFFMLQMLRSLEYDERFMRVPFVQLGVIPPYHRRGPYGNGEKVLANATIVIDRHYFPPCMGIGAHAILYRCSTGRQTWRAVRNSYFVPVDQMMQHLFLQTRMPRVDGTHAETVPYWPLCSGKSSSIFMQDKGEPFVSSREQVR